MHLVSVRLRCRAIWPDTDHSGEIHRGLAKVGFVNAEILSRHLPRGYRRLEFFICGPDPMMDAVESALIELGVPGERVHTERFGMVWAAS